MIGMRWAIRGAGLVSTVILARLLTPADFGLVAMSSLLLGLLRNLSEMGTWQLLIRSGTKDERDYSTAWTLTLLQAVVLAALMLALAAPAAAWFNEPRLVGVIQVTSLGSIIPAFANIGTVMFRRDLDFRRDFVLGVIEKVVHVIPTIVLALVWRSYWALVYGPLIGAVLEVLVSYRLHPFRPRPSLHDWRRFVGFSIWIAPTSMANYLNHKVDVLLVGNTAGTAQLGTYNVASELSRMATAEIVVPMGRALFPNFARLKHDRAALTQAFLMVLRTVAILSFGFGLALAAMAEDVVRLILGAQWVAAVPVIAWLGIFSAFVSMLHTASTHILLVLERERAMAALQWSRLLVFSAAVYWASRSGDIVEVARAATLATGVMLLVALVFVARVLEVPMLRVLGSSGASLLAAAAAAWAARHLHVDGLALPPVTLALDGAVFAAVLVPALALIWWIEGRPDGPERRIVSLFARTVPWRRKS